MVALITRFLPVLAIGFAFSQGHTPFPTDSASWTEVYTDVPLPGDATFHKYFLNGDTLIDNKVYSKLFNSSKNTKGSFFPGGLLAFIREDSAKKVHFRYSANDSDVIIYDFSGSVGDTIYVSLRYEYPQPVQFIVIDIKDTVVFAGKNRRRQLVESRSLGGSHGQYIWIEGIGNIAGPFINDYLIVDAPGNVRLIDFTEGAEISLFDTLAVRVEWKQEWERKEFAAHPNPFNSSITFLFSGAVRESQLSVFSSGGQQVAGFTGVRERQIKWAAPDLPNGVYLVRAKINDRVITEKITLVR